MKRFIVLMWAMVAMQPAVVGQVAPYIVSLSYQMEGLRPVVNVSIQSTQNVGIKTPAKVGIAVEVQDNLFNVLEEKKMTLTDLKYEEFNFNYTFSIPVSPVLSDTAQVQVTILDSLVGKPQSAALKIPNPLPDKNLTLYNVSKNDYSHFSQAYDTLYARSSTKKEIGVYRFVNTFLPAYPPYQEVLPKTPSSLFPDAFWWQKCDEPFVLGDEGLYFFQSDTMGVAGLGVLALVKGYPKYQRVEDLIGPLVYITTQDEYKTITKSTLPKSAFDNFWVNTVGGTQKAGQLLKLYYKRVTEANQLFTTYKEGWKTDKGMIYIVFGPPTRIAVIEQGERWFYEETLSKQQMVFEFVKKNSIFSTTHMDVVRKSAYRKAWIDQVSNWRMGLVETE